MPLTTRAPAAVAIAVAALMLSGCGGSDSSTAAPPPSTSDTSAPSSTSSGSSDPSMKSMVMIQDFKFSTPASVEAGSTVEVMNMDTEAHTVTADSGNAFDVVVKPGQTTTFTAPDKPGSYPFHCTYHSNMHGTLKVR